MTLRPETIKAIDALIEASVTFEGEPEHVALLNAARAALIEEIRKECVDAAAWAG